MPATLEKLSLLKELNSGIAHEHLEEWRKSAVSDEIILANVRTIYDQLEVDKLLNRRLKRMWKRPEDLVPCWSVSGVDPLTDMPTVQGIQIKPNTPRINDKGKPVKYEGARDQETAPLFLNTGKEGYWPNILEDVNQKIFICEGAKKAGALLTNNYAGVSIPGVTTCRKRGRLHQNLEILAKVGRAFYLCFDNDILTKKPVQDALKGMGAVLKSFGAVVMVVQLPPGEFKGVDDYIAAFGSESFQVLVNNALTIQEWVDEIKGQESEDEEVLPNSRLARHYNLVKEKWGDSLRYNTLTKEVELSGQELNEDEVRLTMALEFDIDITNTDAHTIVGKLAKTDEYSPVVEYLNEIQSKYQDIDPSFLDGLALKYFGTSEPMHATYFKKFLISAVARARNPGVKVDTVLMLVGNQGCGKSTFLQHLFGRDFFTDQIGGDLSDKDEKAKVSRYWCLEYAEFESVYKKKDVSSLKKFITSHEDTFRAPYARKEARHPRPSIFAGTTNETEILRDPTGDRRFWVLRILLEDIPLSELLKDRDKIWAAADILYRQGHEFRLTKQEERSRTDLNKEFRTTHYWDDLIEQLWADSQPMTYLTTEMIAKRLGFETAASVKGGDLHTMKECLERLGFTKASKRINGVLSRSCWERKSFSFGSEDFSEKADLPRNTVTNQSQQGFDPVTPLLHPPVTPVTDEEIGVKSTNSENSQTVTVLHPPVTPPVTPSTPCTQSTSETVTVLHPQLSKNLDLESKTETSDDLTEELNLMREGLLNEDYEIVTIFSDQSPELKKAVFDLLTPEEQVKLRQMRDKHVKKEVASPQPKLLFENGILPIFTPDEDFFSVKHQQMVKVFAVNDVLKICSCDVKVRNKAYRVDIEFADLKCGENSPRLEVREGMSVVIMTGKHEGKVSKVSSQMVNQGPIYLNIKGVKATESSKSPFWGHQIRLHS
jgi:predicted P-loop ATPase